MNALQRPKEKKTSGGLFWMLVPFILLVTSVSGWLLMVSIAIDDPGFAVESDYYKKAAAYDDVIAQRSENARLGWTVDVTAFGLDDEGGALLTLLVKDQQGEPLGDLHVSAAVFFNARASEVQQIEASSAGNGIYLIRLERARHGLWEARVRLQGAGVVKKSLRLELASRPHSRPVRWPT